ncbi:hypothetical protein LguiA_002353 [Lonicera macranthoides]
MKVALGLATHDGKHLIHGAHATNHSNKASILILITTLSFIILTTDTQSTPRFLHHVCGNTTTYTPNSTYQKYLNLLLSVLSTYSATNLTFFVNSGQIPDAAFGFYLCRGDVTAAICHGCVLTAATEVTNLCPNQRAAMIWYDECFLRYDNDVPWYGQYDIDQIFYVVDDVDDVKLTRGTRFQQILGETMNKLAERAAFQSPNDHFVKGFATQEANVTGLEKIYELVQCTPDLVEDDCNTCLRFAINYSLRNCCIAKRAARVLLPTCSIRYDTYQFYRTETATAPPPRAPLLVPSSPPPRSLIRPRVKGKVTKLLLAHD